MKPSSHWTNDLIRIIQECRSENQDQRFGQLIFNLIAISDIKTRGNSPNYNENFHGRIFYISDEELIKILKEYDLTSTR